MPLGQKAVLTFGSGAAKPDKVVVSRVKQMFAAKDLQIRVEPQNTRQQYLRDLADPANLVSVYCGHGSEGDIGVGVESRHLNGVRVQPLLVDLESCSPLRSIGTSAAYPNGYDLSSYIGGAHLFANRGEGRCLAVRGASKTSGGNQHEEFFYKALAAGKPVGLAFKDWARQRMELEGLPHEWFFWFYPQVLIGDPLIVVGAAPHYAKPLPKNDSPAAYVPPRAQTLRLPRQPLVKPLLKHFRERGYEFGWFGGAANEDDDKKFSFFKVTDIALDGTTQDPLRLAQRRAFGHARGQHVSRRLEPRQRQRRLRNWCSTRT